MKDTTSRIENGTALWFCEPWARASSAGVINGEDPTKFRVPLLLLQISAVSSFSALFQVLLKPLGNFVFVPQMLSGILLGPSVLGESKKFMSEFFYPRSLFLIESYESICFLFITFLTTAQIDIGMIKRGGKLALINGFLLNLIPMIAALSTAHVILKKTDLATPSLRYGLQRMAVQESTAFFQVIYGALSDFKMLNSELGRVALSSVMVCNCFGWVSFLISASVKRSLKAKDLKTIIGSQGSEVLLVLAIFFVCRPIMVWMMKRTPGGKLLKESYLCGICVMLLLCAFLGETTGFTFYAAAIVLGMVTSSRLPFYAAAIVLGMVTSSRLPLGSGLSDKIGSFVWAVLMPCYVIGIGSRVNLFTFYAEDVVAFELIILVIQIAKFAAVFVPSIYFKVPFSHAVALGFIVNIQGIYDVQIYKQSLNYKRISSEAFSLMVIAAMVHSTIYRIIVRKLYQPSNKYIAYHRLTVQHLRPDTELKILTCFHKLEAVLPILNILELSCPSRGSPISVFVLNLEELQHHTVPVLIDHQICRKPSPEQSRRDQIVNAFRSYEMQKEGTVSVECFTTVAPYTTMHDDVCSMALNKAANVMIVALDRDDQVQGWRICKNILEMAPCSVAIFYNRGGFPDFRSIAIEHLIVNVCVLFIGGADDREALACATRMSNHPSVNLHVQRLLFKENISTLETVIERKLDMRAINQFRAQTVNKEKVQYREVRIEGARNLMDILREDGDHYDLIILGIKHDKEFELVRGLSAWSERKELGVIGDLLLSPDLELKASVLAVQQQVHVIDAVERSSSSNSSKQ